MKTETLKSLLSDPDVLSNRTTEWYVETIRELLKYVDLEEEWTCVADRAPTEDDANEYGWVDWRHRGLGRYDAHKQDDPENLALSWKPLKPYSVKPTYFIRQPDGSFAKADPQPDF